MPRYDTCLNRRSAVSNQRLQAAAIALSFATLSVLFALLAPGATPAYAANLEAGDAPIGVQAAKTDVYVMLDGRIVEKAADDENADGDSEEAPLADETMAIVEGKTAGEVTYDAGSKTMTINGLTAEVIDVNRSLTLNLEGGNRLDSPTKDTTIYGRGIAVDLTITGSGSLDLASSSDDGSIYLGGNKKGSNLIIKGGTINISDFTTIEYGNFKMTGGEVHCSSIEMKGIWQKSGKTKFAKLTLTGGELYVNGFIEAEGHMTNKAECLKKAEGRLPIGARFLAGGNEYQHCVYAEGRPSERLYAKLTKYNAKSKTPKFGKTVKYGGAKYTLAGVGKNAFATAAGKKVKKLTFKETLAFIDAKAFSGTKSLTYLSAKFPISHEIIQSDPTVQPGGYRVIGYQFKWLSSGCKVAKTAFKGCGKNGGKGLSVKLPEYKGPKSQALAGLAQKGLSKKARIL